MECKPTQVRSANAPSRRPTLKQIEDGPGEGQRLLPVENTTQCVDIDLIGNTMREPERERLLADPQRARHRPGGSRARPQRGDPAREPGAARDRQGARDPRPPERHVLEQLAVNSDTILAPLARDRARVASAIRNSSRVAHATAERRDDARRRHRDAAGVPRRARADDGAARRRSRTSRSRCFTDLGAPRDEHQQRRPPARPVLAGRDPGHRLARRGGQDRHARRHRRAARDRRPAHAGEARSGPSARTCARCSSPSATPKASSA